MSLGSEQTVALFGIQLMLVGLFLSFYEALNLTIFSAGGMMFVFGLLVGCSGILLILRGEDRRTEGIRE